MIRLIVRKERPHPGAQLRLTDADGMRLTCFATNTKHTPIAELGLHHRSGPAPRTASAPHGPPACAICPCTTARRTRSGWRSPWTYLAWMPLLALTGQARLWKPRRLRLRLFSTAAQLVTTGRRHTLRLTRHWPWTDVITSALARLDALPNPG